MNPDFNFVTSDEPISEIEPQIIKENTSILFNKDMLPIHHKNLFSNESAFLILSGPSFAKIDKSLLKRAGVLTAGVNNSVFSFRPNLWFSSDPPCNFLKSIWLDPTIQKYIPIDNMHEQIFDSETGNFLSKKVHECPNMVFYKRGTYFDPKTYFYEDHVCWGNEAEDGGKRSVMLVAIRLLHHLGIKNVYLLGCDFKMNKENPYHFKQYRHDSSVKGNNSTYEILKQRFESLKPFMDKEDFHIFNCNPDSDLKVFPHVPFEEALTKCTPKYFPANLSLEPTDGLYDRAYLARLTEKNEKYKKVSFCTTCMDRTHHLKVTYIKNIEDCMKYRPKVEFVLLNYNSHDDLDEWVRDKLKIYIERGVVKYYKTTEPERFKMTHAKNMAARLATGEIIVNLDADTYLGENYFKFIQRKLAKGCYIRKRGEGKGGRICTFAEDFKSVGGYDETFENWGQEDGDFCDRLFRMGRIEIRSSDFEVIKHSNKERMKNYILQDRKQSRIANEYLRNRNKELQVIKVNPNGYGCGTIYDFDGNKMVLE